VWKTRKSFRVRVAGHILEPGRMLLKGQIREAAILKISQLEKFFF
jgi:hypothetical protein